MLKRYWFTFDKGETQLPFGLKIGCGITGYNQKDAIHILEAVVLSNFSGITYANIKSDFGSSFLDENRVVPNMGDLTLRGVWFPLGYAAV